MKNKRSSLKANLTCSQWLAFDTLSAILKGQLPKFSSDGVPEDHIWRINRTNLDRETLWKFFEKRIYIKYRFVGECSYEFSSIISVPKNEGDEYAESRNVFFNLNLMLKPGIHLPPALDFENIFLRIKMEMFNDCGEWYVKKISFIPQSQEQVFTIFNRFSIKYEIA